MNANLGTGGETAGARPEREMRDRGNRRQRLTAESERRNRRQVRRHSNLARGVPFQRQPRIAGIHALAVVFDANQPLPAELRGNDDAARAGIEAVLDQFLDDRCRAFHYLAGRDLIREVNRQPLDLRHQSSNPQSAIRNPQFPAVPQIQLRFLKNTSIAPTATTMAPMIHQNGRGSSGVATSGSFMFMP